MADKNYYSSNQIEINIFKFAKGNHRPFLSQDILDKYFFSHVSLANKSSSHSIFFARDLSIFSRKFEADNVYELSGRIDYITSKEIAFNMEALNYEDVMSVASGRFNPEIVYRVANGIREEVSDKSNGEKRPIIYKEGTNNDSLNYNIRNMEKY